MLLPSRTSPSLLASMRAIARVLSVLGTFAVSVLGQGLDPVGRMDPRAQPLAQVATLAVPALDRVAIEAEDVVRHQNGDPARYAMPFPVQASSATHGTWENLDGTWSLWRLRVQAPGASHINLGFAACQLPTTARLMVYSADYANIVRPFTAADVSANGELWTPVVRGQELVVEVYVQTAQRPQVQVTLGQVGSGYRFFGAGPTATDLQNPETAGTDGGCMIDVACAQGAPWLNESAGVGAISTGGAIFCTGAMLNNAAQNGRCFFLTAYHCGLRAANASSLVVYWNYQNSTCNGIDANLLQFSTGSSLRAEHAATDFTLVELNAAPNPAWGVHWLGWERTCDCTSSAVGIHHPVGRPKKITFDDDALQITSYGGTTSPGDGTHLRVVSWDAGSTQGGSSGSPLFSQNHRVVGQLHGGSAACGNTGSDYYGRLSQSWTGGGTAGTRLSDWLDPGNTGATAVNTYGNASYRTFAGGCAGSLGTSRLTAAAPPNAGSVLQVTVDRLPSNLAAMVTGFNNTHSSLGALPVDLLSFGMPGCFLRVSGDLTSVLVGSNQQAVWSAVMPSGTSALGYRFFQQAFVFDPAAGTAAGLVTSEATTAIISGAPGGIVGGIVPNMVTIAPGTFSMGSNATTGSPYFSQAWERPVHAVTITRPFCIGKYEVTQAEYQAVMGSNPSAFLGANRPVERVTWVQAVAYCDALTVREAAGGRLPSGYEYRLPTEAEWEYCCRAGTTTEFHYGPSLVCGQASFWYSYHSNSSCNFSGTVPVGGYAPNAWGLHDMHGNVWEWCLDSWDGSMNYPAGPVSDPFVSSGPFRVLRGGGWSIDSNYCRSAVRSGDLPSNSYGSSGFRVVCAPVR